MAHCRKTSMYNIHVYLMIIQLTNRYLYYTSNGIKQSQGHGFNEHFVFKEIFFRKFKYFCLMDFPASLCKICFTSQMLHMDI